MKKGKLIVFSGPSGVGKGTIRQELKFNDYVFSISSTTRKIREGEIDGVHYHYISREQFEKKIENGEMLEHAEFVGNYYGTELQTVNKLLDAGKNVFLEIECQGAIQVINKVEDVLSIFILPPSLEELENRLVNRGTEKRSIVDERLQKAKEELALKSYYKYNVINDDLDRVVKEIDTILFEELDA